MSVLIDTSVWSLGLRRRRRDLHPAECKVRYAWEQLLLAGEAEIIGPIRQEILSGIASPREFDQLRDHLASLEDLPLASESFILAAEFFNKCRASGIAPGPLDMMICAASYLHDVQLFTTDPDFHRYAQHLPLILFKW